MRPATIIWFERLIFAMLALGSIQAWSNIHRRIELPRSTLLLVAVVMVGLVTCLTLLVSRRRSKVAMWILIALFLLGLPALFMTIRLARVGGVTGLAAASDLLQNLLQLVAYGLLFTPSARRWMNKEVTLDDLGETFA
jgi:hypothetical protein